MNTTINAGQVLQSKACCYHATGPNTTAFDALEIMANKNIGALLVMENNKLVGVFSERDYARKVILKGKSSKGCTVGELMSSPPITVGPKASLTDCMVLMTKNNIRHLPVIDNGVLKGVMSIRDVVSKIISDQEMVIEQLENYISDVEYK
jgi:CBS domain-containing protein